MRDRYVILKYMRLSLEDGDKQESESISHQRDLIDFFIKNKFKDKENIEVIELVDDGYTGTNMNRPGMKKLIVLAETNCVDCIIVKDNSRFSRDYIEVGKYVEKVFPQLMIRFISINDGYDSKDYIGKTAGLETALQNVAYTMYSRDLSQKIKSVYLAKQKRGEYFTAYGMYGYVKNPDNPKQLIIDPEAAEVVRRIFEMRRKKYTYSQISIILTNEGILTPSRYKAKRGIQNKTWTKTGGYDRWCLPTLRRIIADERYTGKMVGRKTVNSTFEDRKPKTVPVEERIVVENTHEAIISQELFDEVQTQQKRKPFKKVLLPLTGLVKCGNCRRNMQINRKSEKVKFYCDEGIIYGNPNCSCSKILETDLLNVISAAIKCELEKAVDLIKVQERIKSAEKIHRKVEQGARLKIEKLKKDKIDNYIKLTKGIIDEDTFIKERDRLEEQISELTEEMNVRQTEELSDGDLNIINLYQRFYDVKELTNDIMRMLIKAIYIYPDKRVEIIWNFKAEAGYTNVGEGHKDGQNINCSIER